MAAGAAGITLPGAADIFNGAPREDRPNIVFIMADDLGYGHLGCYGQEKIQTPHIDRLAGEGMRFTQAYAGSTVCAPSRAVLMTGQHGGHASVRGNSGGIPLRENDVTVAEVLQQAGYTTGCFGKWGLGEAGTSGVPTEQGFDEFVGYLHQIHAHFYYPEYLWKNEEKFPLPGNILSGGSARGARQPGNAGGRRTQYAPEVIMQHALRFMRANQDRPFFCYLPTVIPHVELEAPREEFEQYAGQFEEEACKDPRPGYAGNQQPKATLAAMISYLDNNVGRVVDLLEEAGIADNTLIIFTSDNGPQSGYCTYPDFFNANGPLRGYKRDMYEGGIRVPAVARWPGRIPAGSESDHAWYFPDVMPTLAELAGTSVPERAATDGLSIAPSLLGAEAAGRDQQEHECLYWELGADRSEDETAFRQAVRAGAWKAVRPTGGAEVELYNLEEDLDESNDLAAERPEMLEQMTAYLEEAHVRPRPQVEPVKVQGRRYR